jgi:hypothetical protein
VGFARTVVKALEVFMAKVGGDIISYCTKCKMDLNHVVEAMVDNVPVRVTCHTCKGQHKYHEPKEAKAVAKAAKALQTVTKTNGTSSTTKTTSSETIHRTPTPRAPKAPAIDPYDTWSGLLKGKEADAKSYTIDSSYKSGDVINHPTFGLGVVEKRLEPKKITVVFRDGAKNLVDNR